MKLSHPGGQNNVQFETIETVEKRAGKKTGPSFGPRNAPPRAIIMRKLLGGCPAGMRPCGGLRRTGAPPLRRAPMSPPKRAVLVRRILAGRPGGPGGRPGPLPAQMINFMKMMAAKRAQQAGPRPMTRGGPNPFLIRRALAP